MKNKKKRGKPLSDQKCDESGCYACRMSRDLLDAFEQAVRDISAVLHKHGVDATDANTSKQRRGRTTVSGELLRMREAAGILGCSMAQTYRLANTGLIPSLRVRGMIRVPRAALMTWIAENSAPASGPRKNR